MAPCESNVTHSAMENNKNIAAQIRIPFPVSSIQKNGTEKTARTRVFLAQVRPVGARMETCDVDVRRRCGSGKMDPHMAIRRYGALVLASLLAAACLSGCAGAGGVRRFWTGAWAAAVQRPSVGSRPNWSLRGFADQTVRQVVRITAGGSAVRVRLSDLYGTTPLRIAGATVAVAADGASVRAGSTRQLTFSRARSVVVPAGRETVSDPVPFRVAPLESLTVTLYLADPTGPATFHSQGFTTSYRAFGDHLGDAGSEAFTQFTHSWYYLSDVEVATARRPPKAIVAFGDSITDGYASTMNANARYPDELAGRLVAMGRPRGVLNAGIGGNLVLHDTARYGDAAMERFDRDVLSRPNVGTVIILEGINDLGFSETAKPTLKPDPVVSVAQLIAAYGRLIARAHAKGIKVIGGTLLPMEDSDHYSVRSEVKREQVNRWIRTSGAYDGVADFDRALADRYDPLRLARAYNGGDHLHPSDAGYRAMARAIDVSRLPG